MNEEKNEARREKKWQTSKRLPLFKNTFTAIDYQFYMLRSIFGKLFVVSNQYIHFIHSYRWLIPLVIVIATFVSARLCCVFALHTSAIAAIQIFKTRLLSTFCIRSSCVENAYALFYGWI